MWVLRLAGLLILLTIGCHKATGQFTRCHSSPGCSGNVVTGPTTAEECCLSATGTYYSDGSTCQQCIVVGWIKNQYIAPEAGIPYTLEIGYLKGTGPNMLVNIEVVPGGDATLNSDFILDDLTTNILIRPGNANRVYWRITLATDSTAQEPDESFQLQLVTSKGLPSHLQVPNAFFTNIITLTIQDRTEISFGFTLRGYEGLEGSGFIEVRVEKFLRLATPVTMIVTPLTVRRAEEENAMNGRPLPPDLNEGENADDDPFSPNRATESDFDTQTISIMFEVDETGVARNRDSVRVGVTMDNVNEAQTEIFIAILEVGNALNRTLISDTGTRATICHISDDDEIELGYESTQYNLDEPSPGPTDPITYSNVRIIKSIVTEQTLLFGIIVSPIEATQQTDDADNDFNVYGSTLNLIQQTFNPSDQNLTVTIDIFPDMVLESVERFRLGISAPYAGDPSYLTDVILPGTTTVSISNMFVFVIGLDPVSQSVTEDQGYAELCTRITDPPDDVTIPPNVRFTLTPITVEGSAANSDYRQLFPASVLLDFDNDNRIQCFNVTIINDGVEENTEQFSVQLTTLGPRPSNLRLEPDTVNIRIVNTSADGTCIPLRAIVNGRVMYSMTGTSSSYPAGTVATYSCNSEFFFWGSFSRTCVVDPEGNHSGSFNGVEPRCISIAICGELPAIANGRISYVPDSSPPFSLNTVATYSCNPGYYLVVNSGQSEIRTCLSGGIFDEMAPSCDLTPPVGDQFTSCHSAPGCSGNVVTGPTTAEECCLSEFGTYYNDGSTCQQCIVFGWTTNQFIASESGAPYTLEIGYHKGTGPNLLVNIEVVPGGAATLNSDFIFHDLTTNILIQPGDANRAQWRISLVTDSIAQEPDESFQLQLVTSLGLSYHLQVPNAFFINIINLTIQDQTEIDFSFTLREYEGLEGSGFIPVAITKNRRLATPVTLVLTPLTVMRAEEENAMNGRPLPPDLNERENADNDPFSPNRAKESDFDTQPINVTFEADEGAPNNRQTVRIGITRDEIDESAQEIFVAIVEVHDALNPNLISEEGIQAAILQITDDDEVEIGYEFTEYNVDEPAPGATDPITYSNVRIIKSIVTEQTLLFGVIVNPIEATQQTDDADNDFNVYVSTLNLIQRTFNPSDQDLTVTIDIFPDMVFESVETFQLRISAPNAGDPSYLTDVTLPGTTTVSIINNFVFVIGLDPVSQSVTEDQGFAELCARFHNPHDDVTIPPNIRFTLTPITVEGSAGDSDYSQLFPASVLLDFDNDNRVQCFNVSITDDNVYENTELFSVRLTMLGPRPDNLRFDPEVANVTIVDTTEVTIGFIGSPYSATEDMGPMVFMIGVIGYTILDRDVVVSFSTVDGSTHGSMAVAGSDYMETSVSLTFNAVTRLLNVAVSLINDDTLEMTENFRAVLSFEGVGSGRAISSPMEATATIIDDEVSVAIFQIRFGRLNCVEYSSSSSLQKIEEISATLAENTETLCSCGFNSSFLLKSQLQCFEQSPQTVTYRTQLTARTSQFNTTELLSYIKQWIRSSEQLVVNGVRLILNESCSLVVSSFESEECPSTATTTKSSAATTHFPGSKDGANVGAIVASVIAGVLFLVFLVSVFPLVLCIFRSKCNKQQQVSERNEIELQGNAESSVPEYEVVENADVVYEEIIDIVKPRGHIEASQQPHPPKGEYEYTQCPAYGPVNREAS